MKFRNSSLYMQKQTNQMLKSFRNFSRIYINDIIIFFKILDEYINYFSQIFQLFRNKKITLILIKLFFTYSSMILLKQRINNFEILIFEKKIAIIISLRLSESLRDLKYFLNLTN